MSPISPIFTSMKPVETPYGMFLIDVFSLGGTEALVLHTPEIPGVTEEVLCRIQSECVGHIFDSSCDCVEQIRSSLSQTSLKGGLLIYLRQDGMGLGLAAKLSNDSRDCREYHIAVDILNYYSIHSVNLISLDKRKIESLKKAPNPINVLTHSWHGGRVVTLGNKIDRTIERIRQNAAYRPLRYPPGKPRMLVLGDLNIDQHESGHITVGGTGYNAVISFKRWNQAASGEQNRGVEPLIPIIFGKIGDDDYGRQIRQSIEKEDIDAFLGIHNSKKTGHVRVIRAGDPLVRFQYKWEKNDNANDYDIENLDKALELIEIGSSDYVFIASYLFVQKFYDESEIHRIIERLSRTGASLVLDLVRKSVARDVLDDCEQHAHRSIPNVDLSILGNILKDIELYAIISDARTLNSIGFNTSELKPECLSRIMNSFHSKWLVCRHEFQGQVHQRIVKATEGGGVFVLNNRPLGGKYDAIGDGDFCFAEALTAMRIYESDNR